MSEHPNLPSSQHDQPLIQSAQEMALRERIAVLERENAIQQAILAELNKVTAREQEKAATERATQLAKTNITLKKTLDVLATEPDLDRVLGHVLQVMSEQLESSSSALWLFNPDLDAFRLSLVYLNGSIIPATPENADRLNNQWIRNRNLSRDLTLKDHIRDRRPVIYYIENVEQSPVIYKVDNVEQLTPSSRKFLESLGVKTLLGVPLLMDSKIVGSLTIRFGEKREFQVEELELTQALAHQATLAIQLLRMAEDAKQAVILEERNRLAGEIHDTLAQAFSAISIQLGVAKRIAHQDPEEVQQILDRTLELAQAGLAQARRSVWALYLDATKYTDLAQSLSASVKQLTTSTPVQVELNIQDTACTLPTIVSMNLLRIGQEALLNALKHAQATIIWIDLTCESQEVSLSVRDNGRGFTLPASQDVSGGFGLLGMYQRAGRIGGQLTIATQPGQGTEVLVYAPLSLITNYESS